jgi:hypothetical protein
MLNALGGLLRLGRESLAVAVKYAQGRRATRLRILEQHLRS